jgi:hypothetical protein
MTMQPIIIAMSLALALSVYWVYDNIDCLFDSGTDTCVECVDDCMDKE